MHTGTALVWGSARQGGSSAADLYCSTGMRSLAPVGSVIPKPCAALGSGNRSATVTESQTSFSPSGSCQRTRRRKCVNGCVYTKVIRV